jgi:hypothetical protein
MYDVWKIGDREDIETSLRHSIEEGEFEMKITDDAWIIKQTAQSVRQNLEHRGLTVEVMHVSQEAYEECVARSVLEQERIPVTEKNINIVLNAMKM